MNTQLQVKPIKVPKSEQYNFAIRSQVEKIENKFRIYVKKKLNIINAKGLQYSRYRVDQVKKLGKAYVVTKPVFNPQDFHIDLNGLLPVLDIGVGFQRKKILGVVVDDNLDLNASTQIALHLDPASSIVKDAGQVQFNNLIHSREILLQDWIEKTSLDKIYKITEDGINAGLSYEKIAVNLSTSLGFDGSRAEKIARTETNWALNDGTRQYVKELGVTEYKVSPADDACEECIIASKLSYNIDDNDILPIHISCRCTLISVIPDSWLATEPDEMLPATFQPFAEVILPGNELQTAVENVLHISNNETQQRVEIEVKPTSSTTPILDQLNSIIQSNNLATKLGGSGVMGLVNPAINLISGVSSTKLSEGTLKFKQILDDAGFNTSTSNIKQLANELITFHSEKIPSFMREEFQKLALDSGK